MTAADPGSRPLFLAPLSVEAMAIRSGAPWAEVRRTGMGPRRAMRAVDSGVLDGFGPVVIAGFCGALDPRLEPGEIVLADELRGPDGTRKCDDMAIVTGVLRAGGLSVRVGPIVSSGQLVRGAERRALYATGAVAVDMESAWLASAIRTRPLVVLRVVLDTEARELHRPLRTLAGFRSAYRALRQAASLLEEWGSDPPSRAGIGGPGAAPETMGFELPQEVNRRSR